MVAEKEEEKEKVIVSVQPDEANSMGYQHTDARSEPRVGGSVVTLT
jgi:hypothetical protein